MIAAFRPCPSGSRVRIAAGPGPGPSPGARRALALGLVMCAWTASPAAAQVAVRGDTVHTMAGPPITDGVVLIREGRIERVGPASEVSIPEGYRTLRAAVVTPGLVDAHSVVGVTGYLNQEDDQEQLEGSDPVQPQLRAIDAYDVREPLIEWVRSFGVTTLHTGHGPGALVSGQTMIVKTRGETIDEAVVRPFAMVATTLGNDARAEQGKSPGTRAKMIAMLRAKLLEARQYADRQGGESPPARDLALDVLGRVLAREVPLLVTVHRAHDIVAAIRLAREYDIRLVLDGAAEAYLVVDQIRESGFPVIVHPAQQRAAGETENLSMETAARLKAAGIPIALQSGFEAYVPKTRVLLFEAGVAAANELGFDASLAAATIDAARLLGIDDRVGSLEPGKDGDVALYDGDPFEYTTHCVATIIEGEVVSEGAF